MRPSDVMRSHAPNATESDLTFRELGRQLAKSETVCLAAL